MYMNIFEKGLELHKTFMNERFVEKTKPLSATIHRANFPSFDTVPSSTKSNPANSGKLKKNYINRIFALAKERNYSLQALLTYDIPYDNSLFDKDGFTKKENC